MRSTRRFVLSLLAVATACSEGPVSPVEFVAVRTDRPEYSAGQFVVFTVENRGSESVDFYHCNYNIGLHLDRRSGGQWVEEYHRSSMCIAIYPVGSKVLSPGETLRDSVAVVQPGDYRIRLPVGDGTGMLDSNAFAVAAH